MADETEKNRRVNRMNKQSFNSKLDLNGYKDMLVDGIFKTLPLMEKDQNWEKHLEGLIIELRGAQILFEEPKFIPLVARLSGLLTLTAEELKTNIFRKTIFDSISLVKTFFLEDVVPEKEE